MRVGVMVPDLVANDAVGNDALGMYLSLLRKGIEVYLFTGTGDATTPLNIFSYKDILLLLDSPDDVLIYHYCIGDDDGLAVLRNVRCSINIKYHNVTPAAFTMAYSTDYSRVSRVGREMLTDIAELPIAGIIGDSQYNSAEFKGVVAKGTPLLVVPPFHQIDQLLGMLADSGMMAQVTSKWFNILAVGRIVPNKGFALMLEVLAAALQKLKINVHLHIVGTRDLRLSGYLDQLEQIIRTNDLGDSITWHGSVDAAALATLYRQSDLFWTTSQHEGFCVPVVEAMAFGLPILSSRKGALVETCGDAAVFADSSDDCLEMLGRLVVDDLFRVAMGRKGQRRYNDMFRLSQIDRKFHSALQYVQKLREEKVDPASLAVDGEWFGLPDAENLIREGLGVSGFVHPGALMGVSRRLDFVDWILRDGWRKSRHLSRRLAGQDIWQYAEDIEVPLIAAQLDPLMRLRWQFSRAAHSSFNLCSPESVSAFIRWHHREKSGAYNFPRGDAAKEMSST